MLEQIGAFLVSFDFITEIQCSTHSDLNDYTRNNVVSMELHCCYGDDHS